MDGCVVLCCREHPDDERRAVAAFQGHAALML
jgi:hypothetical protein